MMAQDSVIDKKSINIRTCRICLATQCKNMVNLNDNSAWLCLYTYCSGLSLTANDEPRRICGDCADTLKKFGLFKEKCTKSDKLWKKLITEVSVCTEKIEIKVETDDINTIENSNESIVIQSDDDDIKIKTEYLEDTDNEVLNNTDGSYKYYTSDNEVQNYIDKESCKDYTSDNEVLDNTDYTEDCQKPSVKKQEYECKKCNKIYGKEHWYIKHIKICKGIKPKINEDEQRKSPITEQNQVYQPSLFCGFCNITSTDDTELKKHLDEHWTNGDLKCKVCEFVSGDLAQAMAHRFSHTPKQKYECHICGILSRKLSKLEFHYRSVHLNKKGGYCFICNREYLLYTSWHKHNLQHTTPGYTCDLCGKTFFYKIEIIAHIRQHTVKQFMCDQCGKEFNKLYNFKSHCLSVHNKEQPVKCAHCNSLFKNQLTLKRHLDEIKKGRRHKCDECNKSFYKSNYLKLHSLVHTGEKPHSCDICGSSFRIKAHLKEHLRRHTGLKPYKCELCDQSFLTTNQRKRHMYIHTGVKIHKCQLCEKSFHNKHYLDVHCAKKHNA